MTEVYIAEKPSLARAIADGLGGKRKEESHIVCEGGKLVTWCYGHILEEYMPEDYNAAWKDWQCLPVIPNEWKRKANEGAKKQLAAIGELLSKADAVVHAGDPDREGQAIVDEVLEHFGWRGPTRRLWLASLDAVSVRKALDAMKDNAGYAHLRDAAIARSRADWLTGINMTRALTNIGRDCGHEGKLSAGRVQSAVLNLVVMRDRERAAFKPSEYFVLQGRFTSEGGSFTARFRPGETQAGLDAEGRLVDMAAADAIIAAVRGKSGGIVSQATTPGQKKPPLPYSLSALQKAASATLGMTAKEVLETAQALYEKKLTTYPRTDCRYLPSEQFGDAERILGALAAVPGLEEAAKGADAVRRSAAWDTGKVTAHHAVIPTGELPANLTEKERALYQMIARAYIMQFYGALSFETHKLTVDIAKTLWDAAGRRVLDPGWTAVDTDEDADGEESQALPALAQGCAVTCDGVETQKKKTSPPARWTEGTLIEAMANVHRFVLDPSAKAVLRENEGIGTEATRADALEKLKSAGYIKADGKALVSTRLGGQVVDILPSALKDPVTTAQWERRLTDIASGRDSLDAFTESQIAALPDLLAPMLSGELKIQVDGKVFPCPVCGKPLFRRAKDGDVFWQCRRTELHPEGKSVFLPDERGRPLERTTDIDCPACAQAKLQRYKGTRKDGSAYDFFKCAACEATFANEGGTPVRREKREKTLSEHVCPDCGKPLAVREGTARSGRAWMRFDCTGFPACKKSWWGKNGAPDFDNPAGKK